MFLSIALFVFIYSQHACAKCTFCENSSTSYLSPSLEKDRRSVEPFLWWERTAGRVFDLRKRGAGSDGKEEDRGSPVLIPSILRCQRGRCCEDAHENSLLKESPPPPGAKHTQWKPLIMRSVSPLESRLCMLHSQSDHRTNCVYAARDIAWAGRNTVCNVIYFRPFCLWYVCFLVFSFSHSFLFLSFFDKRQ